jgi:hypothetical protein
MARLFIAAGCNSPCISETAAGELWFLKAWLIQTTVEVEVQLGIYALPKAVVMFA